MAPDNFVTLQALNPAGTPVQCGLIGNAAHSRQGGTSASASSGGGGWQIVDRVLNRAATEWLDFNPMVMTLNLILDGGLGSTAQSVEGQIAIIESYETPAPGTQPPLPPIIGVSGPIPHTDTFWVCSRLTFPGDDGAAIRDGFYGWRTQQLFAIELTEYTASSVTTSNLTPAQQAQQAAALLG